MWTFHRNMKELSKHLLLLMSTTKIAFKVGDL